MNPLDNLEQLAQRFVEGTFHRFFGKRLHPVDLRERLVERVEAERNGRADNLIPASYCITLNPVDYTALVQQHDNRTVTAELTAFLVTFAGEANVQFDGSLQVKLDRDESVEPGQIQIGTNKKTIDRGHP
jgi:hypothetical protein